MTPNEGWEKVQHFVRKKTSQAANVTNNDLYGLEFDDIYNQTCLNFLERFHNYDPNRGSLTTFAGVVFNSTIARLCEKGLRQRHISYRDMFDFDEVDTTSCYEILSAESGLEAKLDSMSRHAKQYACIAYGDSTPAVEAELERIKAFLKYSGQKLHINRDASLCREALARVVQRKVYERPDGTVAASVVNASHNFRKAIGE